MSAAAEPAVRDAVAPGTLFWIDLLRVAGAAAVVFLHVAAQPVVLVEDRGRAIWWSANAIDSALRWCVPIFVMVSGALLLAPRGEPMGEFFSRRVRRLALPLVAWSAAYLLLHGLRFGMPDWGWIGQRILQGRPEYHLWYVYMTLGLYLCTPWLRRFTARASPRQLALACASLLLAASLHDALDSFGLAPQPRTVFTMFLPYLGYYLAGHALVRSPIRVPTVALAAVVTACAAGIASGTFVLMERHGSASPAGLYLYEYLSPPVVAMSLAVFLLGSRVPPPRSEGHTALVLRDGSAATLGVYLIHPMWIDALRAGGLDPVGLGIAGVPLVASLALGLSYAAVSLLRRTPWLRHTV